MTTWEEAIEAAIQKEINVLGKTVALRTARQVPGLEVEDDGRVTGLERDGKQCLAELVGAYQDIGGAVSATLIARSIKQSGGDDLDLPDILAERI